MATTLNKAKRIAAEYSRKTNEPVAVWYDGEEYRLRRFEPARYQTVPAYAAHIEAVYKDGEEARP